MYVTVWNKISVATYGYIMSVLCNFFIYLFFPGRDDGPADCIVFFGFMDIFRISTMVVMENTGQQKLQNMVGYCQNVDR